MHQRIAVREGVLPMMGREGSEVRGSGFVQRQQPFPQGVAGGLSPVGGADLLLDIGHVPSCRALGDDQFFGDLYICLAAGDEAQDLYLSLDQTAGVGWGGVRQIMSLF